MNTGHQSNNGQLSLVPPAGRKMSSSLWTMGWRPSVADWGSGMSASCNRGPSCSLMRAMDGRIVHCGIISSCQSAATSETVTRFWSRTQVRSGEVFLVPAGGDVRLGAADWALETANVTASLSDERWAWAVEFVSVQWQWAVLTGQVEDETDVTSQVCVHQSSMLSTTSVIGSWIQNIVDNEVIVTQNMSSPAQPSESYKLSQWHGDFTSWADCIIWNVVLPPDSQYCLKPSRLKYVQFIT